MTTFKTISICSVNSGCKRCFAVDVTAFRCFMTEQMTTTEFTFNSSRIESRKPREKGIRFCRKNHSRGAKDNLSCSSQLLLRLLKLKTTSFSRSSGNSRPYSHAHGGWRQKKPWIHRGFGTRILTTSRRHSWKTSSCPQQQGFGGLASAWRR